MPDVPAFVGRYEILSLLGRGGMGAVYLAQDPVINRKVAIKVLSERFDDDELLARFRREARAAGGLRHPNIVTIHDVGEQDTRPFIVMEHVPGETLAELIRRKAPLTLTRKLQIIEELCAGLAHAHAAGIIHRDVKPSNIIVDESGVLKILDFGIAKAGDTGLTKPGAMPGTLNYMPPELIMSGPIDKRADVFAVGAVLYELLAYRQAFPGTFVDGVFQKIAMGTPEPIDGLDEEQEIATVIDRALAKRPDERFADLSEMQAQLARIRKRVEASEVTMRRPRPQPAPHEAETELVARPKPTPRPAPVVPVAPPTPTPRPVSAIPVAQDVAPAPSVAMARDAAGTRDVRVATEHPAAPNTAVSPWNAYVIVGILLALLGGLLIPFMVSSPREINQVETESTSSAVPGPERTPLSDRKMSSVDGREMVWIPAGEFQMGSPASEPGRSSDEGLHAVSIASGFWLDVTEVTNQAYQLFVLANAGWQKDRINPELRYRNYLSDWNGNYFPADKENYPVVNVSWQAAVSYCSWAGKRLPTEAEWEYAARAGTTTAYWWSDGFAFDPTRANINQGSTEAVGRSEHVNAWGLADMLGNVWEWTSTIYRPYPYRADDGREDSSSRGTRAIRGGAWSSADRSYLRAAARFWFDPRGAGDGLGFRCAQ